MGKRFSFRWVALPMLGLLLSGHSARTAPGQPQGQWFAQRIRILKGFRVPECVAVDPVRGWAYVSNIQAAEDGYWKDDGKAFISSLKPGGELVSLQWRQSFKQAPLNAPKGMCVLRDRLFIADNTRIVSYSLGKVGWRPFISIPGSQRLNDMATDGQALWVSDTGASKVFCIAGPGIFKFPASAGEREQIREFPAPEMVNGITFFQGKMFAVSWNLHEVYEMDPSGRQPPKPFGVANHFTSLDGIEVLDDGTFLVSDFNGNKVCTIGPDRKTVRILLEIESPADIGLDRKRGLLYVPQFKKDQVAVYRLRKS